MNIEKVYGQVAEEKSSNSCRIEVLGFFQNGKLVTDKDIINSTFQPLSHVFSYKFFDRFDDINIGDVVEFHVQEKPTGIHDKMLLDSNRACKRVGCKVVDVGADIFSNPGAINQPILKQYINTEIGNFFIRHQGNLFGPFKNHNKEVVPKMGQIVHRYAVPEGLVKVNDEPYLLLEPTKKEDLIDCMTQSQLATYLGTLVGKLNITTEIGPVKKALEAMPADGLEKAKLERLVKNMDQLELGLTELKILAIESEKFQKLYQRSLDRVNEELKKENMNEVLDQKEMMEKEVKTIKQSLDKLKREEQKLTGVVSRLKDDQAYLNSEKEKLIQDIRIRAEIEPSQSGVTAIVPAQLVKCYEEQVWEAESESYLNLNEFINVLKQSVKYESEDQKRIDFNFINLLKLYRCFLVENVDTILRIAEATQNCKVILQQVEPDWIKFEKFLYNGLEQIWEAAHANPNMIHFLVLEDINLSGFECYGRPISDLINGRRRHLPTCNTPWPPNLWIFADFIPPDDKGFGLPMSKSTFNEWGYVPYAPYKWIWNAVKNKLKPETLVLHTNIAGSPNNPYLT